MRRVTINIMKIGQKQFSGTKIVTILAEMMGHVITKNTTPLRWSQMDAADPQTKTLDLRIPPTIVYEITGHLENIHQVLTTSDISSGSNVVVPVTTTAGFSVNDIITIASLDGSASNSASIVSIDSSNNTITVDTASYNYPSGSMITKELTSNPKDDLLAIIKDLGACTLIYGTQSVTVQISKASIKEKPSSVEGEESYEIKLSVFETEDLE